MMADNQRPPFDQVRGAFIILWIILGGMVARGMVNAYGCFKGVEGFCQLGDGIKDILGQIVAMVALLLGARRPPGSP